MTKRILLVDDEVDFTAMLKARLEQAGGYIVRVENDSRKALLAARESRPQLILIDIMMPHMDGSELAAHFLSDDELKRVPLAFLTALVTRAETTGNSLAVCGRRTYLPKPVDFGRLLQFLDEAMQLHGAAR